MKPVFYLLLLIPFLTGSVVPDKTVHVLFVGNSLTYSNNLPKLMEEKAKANGTTMTTDILAFPNYALEDHWNDGQMQKQIASGKYQYVIVQQGPSSQGDGRAMLLDYGQRIKSICDEHNSRLAFFMVWPAQVNAGNFQGVITNYTDAAKMTGSLLCPVGKVWRDHFEATQDYSYYGPDGFHPSLEGSEVAAEVIFESLTMKPR